MDTNYPSNYIAISWGPELFVPPTSYVYIKTFNNIKSDLKCFTICYYCSVNKEYQ